MRKSPIRNSIISDQSFGRKEHLKGRKEIREVFNKGKQYSCHGAKLFVLGNGLSYNRICFTFAKGKALWNAVKRNRARRLGREAFRLMKDRLEAGFDLIFLVYPETEGAATLPGAEKQAKACLQSRRNQFDSLFFKAGLLK
ncbi:MAG: ribonuclease P protein component [Treponema sp.]|jgi:ribonuclease P protein component|nr:ribonuclease P protein component [Treponema sp.]